MNTLSRREEETLMKATKARALDECRDLVKGSEICVQLDWEMPTAFLDFADCATGRTVTVAWACKEKWNRVKECMVQL
jgi:COX assembly protein 1